MSASRSYPPLFPVSVVGRGAVSPAGLGVEALFDRRDVKEAELSSLRRPDSTPYPVFRVDSKLPALERWAREPRLRRASPVALFLVEAASQALEGVKRPPDLRLGIVGAFFCGCSAYSRRFFEQTIRLGQSAASPALFPETVYNSPLSHAAAVLGIDGAAYAIVGDDTAWLEALRIGATWLALDQVDAVVVAAAEELDIISVEAYAMAGWFHSNASFRPSEGGAAVVLRRANPDQVEDRVDAIHLGESYRDPVGASNAANNLLRDFFPDLPVAPTAGHSWLEGISRDATGMRLDGQSAPYLGEAFVATAGWNMLRALARSSDPRGESGHVVPIWGQNHRISALKLSRS